MVKVSGNKLYEDGLGAEFLSNIIVRELRYQPLYWRV